MSQYGNTQRMRDDDVHHDKYEVSSIASHAAALLESTRSSTWLLPEVQANVRKAKTLSPPQAKKNFFDTLLPRGNAEGKLRES